MQDFVHQPYVQKIRGPDKRDLGPNLGLGFRVADLRSGIWRNLRLRV